MCRKRITILINDLRMIRFLFRIFGKTADGFITRNVCTLSLILTKTSTRLAKLHTINSKRYILYGAVRWKYKSHRTQVTYIHRYSINSLWYLETTLSTTIWLIFGAKQLT